MIPMRTMNSTYTAFADPLIWVLWVSPTAPNVSSNYVLYEDAGDGREYEDRSNTARATTGAALKTSQKLIYFEVEASSGSYAGQGTTRQQLVQLRGIDGDQIDTVKIDGLVATKSWAGAAGNGEDDEHVAACLYRKSRYFILALLSASWSSEALYARSSLGASNGNG